MVIDILLTIIIIGWICCVALDFIIMKSDIEQLQKHIEILDKIVLGGTTDGTERE